MQHPQEKHHLAGPCFPGSSEQRYNLRGAKFTMPTGLLSKAKSQIMSKGKTSNEKTSPYSNTTVLESSQNSCSLKNITIESEVSQLPNKGVEGYAQLQQSSVSQEPGREMEAERVRSISRLIRQRYKVMVYRRKQRNNGTARDIEMERVMASIQSYFYE